MSWVKRRRFSLENRIIKKKKKKIRRENKNIGSTISQCPSSNNSFFYRSTETTERVPKKKRERKFLSAPLSSLSGTPLFPQTFHFYLRVSCFPPSLPFPLLSSSPNFLFLHPFSTTFAYPAGAITTAGNKNGAFTTGWCKQPRRGYIRLSSMQASKVYTFA